MIEVLLDTSTLSDIMKGRNRSVTRQARQYLIIHKQFTFSILTRYEILRGLEAKKATKQITTFNRLCEKSRVLPLIDEIIVIASQIYAELRKKGKIISDADILIAATGRYHKLPLITENAAHFQRISGLLVKSWR